MSLKSNNKISFNITKCMLGIRMIFNQTEGKKQNVPTLLLFEV